jgi:hypothetical protein
MLKVTAMRAIWLGALMLGIAWLESSSAFQYQIKSDEEQQETSNTYKEDFATFISTIFGPVGHFVHRYKDEITAASTAFIAVFTAVLGGFTISLARSTKKAVKTAQAEFIASHRPRLVIREVQRLTPADSDRSIELRYVVANIGDNDAKIIESHIELQDIRDGILRPLQRTEGANRIGLVTLIPGEHIFREQGSNISLPSLVVSRMVEDRQRPRVRQPSETRGVYFRGLIIYADKNGVRRRTGICRVYEFKTERFYPLDDPDYEYAD